MSAKCQQRTFQPTSSHADARRSGHLLLVPPYMDGAVHAVTSGRADQPVLREASSLSHGARDGIADRMSWRSEFEYLLARRLALSEVLSLAAAILLLAGSPGTSLSLSQLAEPSPPEAMRAKGSRTITFNDDRSARSRNVILPGGVVTIFPMVELGMPNFADSLAK